MTRRSDTLARDDVTRNQDAPRSPVTSRTSTAESTIVEDARRVTVVKPPPTGAAFSILSYRSPERMSQENAWTRPQGPPIAWRPRDRHRPDSEHFRPQPSRPVSAEKWSGADVCKSSPFCLYDETADRVRVTMT